MKFSKIILLSFFLVSFFACSNQEEISEMEVVASDEIQSRTTDRPTRACNRFVGTPYQLLLCSQTRGGGSDILVANHEPFPINLTCNLSFTPQSIDVFGGVYQLDIVSTPTNNPNELFNTNIAVLEESLRSNDNLPGQTTVPLGTQYFFEYDETRTYWYLASVGTATALATLTADVVGPCPQLFGAQIGDFINIGLNDVPTFSFTCSVAC